MRRSDFDYPESIEMSTGTIVFICTLICVIIAVLATFAPSIGTGKLDDTTIIILMSG